MPHLICSFSGDWLYSHEDSWGCSLITTDVCHVSKAVSCLSNTKCTCFMTYSLAVTVGTVMWFVFLSAYWKWSGLSIKWTRRCLAVLKDRLNVHGQSIKAGLYECQCSVRKLYFLHKNWDISKKKQNSRCMAKEVTKWWLFLTKAEHDWLLDIPWYGVQEQLCIWTS